MSALSHSEERDINRGDGEGISVNVQFLPVAPALRSLISTYFVTEVHCPDGQTIEDFSHPEWAVVRFHNGSIWGSLGGGPRETRPQATLTGPCDVSLHLSTGSMRIFGFGLMPLGWLHFMPQPARSFSNRIVGLDDEHGTAHFAPLAPDCDHDDLAAVKARWDEQLCALLPSKPPRGARAVAAMQDALVDPDIATPATLADRAGVSITQAERLARRAFGMPPTVLLRRQRFLRTLARVMMTPETSWIAALDDQYYDQAQFSRDFKRFMGLTPRDYLSRPRPLMDASIAARAQAIGEGFLGLHSVPSRD
jgi:AraC-like DNA-binding protein